MGFHVAKEIQTVRRQNANATYRQSVSPDQYSMADERACSCASGSGPSSPSCQYLGTRLASKFLSRNSCARCVSRHVELHFKRNRLQFFIPKLHEDLIRTVQMHSAMNATSGRSSFDHSLPLFLYLLRERLKVHRARPPVERQRRHQGMVVGARWASRVCRCRRRRLAQGRRLLLRRHCAVIWLVVCGVWAGSGHRWRRAILPNGLNCRARRLGGGHRRRSLHHTAALLPRRVRPLA